MTTTDADRRVPKRTRVEHLTTAERTAHGKAARAQVPRSSHAELAPGPQRPDPIALLESQAATRVPELVPIRYGRMLVSPFTFYRGAAPRHGHRPRRHARLRPARPALRRRPPVELRRLRQPRAAAGVRHQRLRRDAARPVRVGRQAARGELRGGRPRPRLRRRRPRGDRAGLRRAPTARRWPSFAAHDQPRRLVRAARRRGDASPATRRPCRARRSSAPRRTSPRRAPRTACRRFAQADPRGRRRAAHHGRPAADRADPGPAARRHRGGVHRVVPRAPARLPAHARAPTAATCSSATASSTWPARWSGWAASARGPGSC